MESHDVIRTAFKKRGPKEVAAEMGLSLSLVYKWAQPNTDHGSGSRNPLDRVNQLRQFTEDTGLIQWLCEQAGGYFVRNPRSFCEDGFEVVPATNEIVQQFADLLSTISKAAVDSSITDDESEQIRGVWEQLKGFTEGFVRCCEEGDFEHIPKPGEPRRSRK
jgi:hypothetical protein